MRHERICALTWCCLMQSQRLCSFRKWCLLYQFSEHTSVPGVILLNKCLSISTGSTVYILYMYTCVYIHICTAYLGYIFGTHTHIYPMLWTGQAATLNRKLAFKPLAIRGQGRKSKYLLKMSLFFLLFKTKRKLEDGEILIKQSSYIWSCLLIFVLGREVEHYIVLVSLFF